MDHQFKKCINEIFYILLFWYQVLGILCVCCTYSIFSLDEPFQKLCGHTFLVATTLDRVDLDLFSHL